MNSQKVVFECSGGMFCLVALVDMQGHQLVLAPIVSDGVKESCAGLFVQDVYILGCMLECKLAVEVIVHCNVMGVVL